VRPVLPLVLAPTLILHRRGFGLVPIEHGRYLAEHIAGAKLVELPGSDVDLSWETPELALDSIQEFGAHHPILPSPRPPAPAAVVTGTDPTATANWASTRRPVWRPAGVDTIDTQGRTQRQHKRRRSMPTFLLSHRAPTNSTGRSADAMAAWNAWFDSLGADLVDRGNPVFAARTLGNCGAGTALGGYTLVTADDLDAAVTLARGCPFLQHDGGIEVGELTLLNRGTRQIGDDPA
jgi:hypothetical protein